MWLKRIRILFILNVIIENVNSNSFNTYESPVIQCQMAPQPTANQWKFVYSHKSSSNDYSLKGSAPIKNFDPICETKKSDLDRDDVFDCEFFMDCIAPHIVKVTLDTRIKIKEPLGFQLSSLINLTQLHWNMEESCQPVNQLIANFKSLGSLYLNVDDTIYFNECKELHNISQMQLKKLHVIVNRKWESQEHGEKKLSFEKTFLNGMKNLEVFEFDAADPCKNITIDIDTQMFQGLTNLSNITIENCELANIERDHFQNLNNLKFLRLKNIRMNNIDWLSSETLKKHLEYLDITKNTFNITSYKYEFPSDIENELLRNFEDYRKLSIIELFGLSKIAFKASNYNITAFICDKSDETCNFITDIHKKPCPDDCLCSLDRNNMRFDIDCHNSKTLSAIPELPIPIIGNTSLSFSNKNLTILPNTTLKGYSGVRELHLSNNQLSNLTVDQLPKNLKYLDLRGNRFQILNESVVQYLWNRSSSLQIKLSENPWICSCSNYYLVNFVSESTHILDRKSIFCSDRKLGPMAKLTKTDLCGVPFGFANPIFITGINVVVVVIIIILFRNKKLIVMLLYRKGWWIPTDPKEDINFKYDAFVAFCHKDLDKAEKLVNTLENETRQFKICYYDRDWLAGEFILNNILKSIEESQRTIILLTKDFIDSTWGRLEFQTAIKACSSKSRKRLIVILYPGADINKLGYGLRNYLKYNIYLKEGERHFWTKLIYEMPHTTVKKIQAAADIELETVNNDPDPNHEQFDEMPHNPTPREQVHDEIELERVGDT